jgi:glyoxylase-like metal-dependent hydrolase (beta-lactamase superfamily II)
MTSSTVINLNKFIFIPRWVKITILRRNYFPVNGNFETAINYLKQLLQRFPYLRANLTLMLAIHAFTFNPFQENTYVVYSASGECVIVDPGCSNATEEQALDRFISEKGLKVVCIWCTHCHIDHVFGLAFAARQYQVVPLIPKAEQPVLDAVERVAEMYGLSYYGSPEVAYFESAQQALGGQNLEILQVPGHSPGHIAFYHRESAQLLSGDVLFHRSIGRTDLPGGDMDTLITSIRTQLFTLPGVTKVYPGHMQPTTIAEEIKHNPFLR